MKHWKLLVIFGRLWELRQRVQHQLEHLWGLGMRKLEEIWRQLDFLRTKY
jgi:hypothetical protein